MASLSGFSNVLAEVDPNTRAVHMSPRPVDVGVLGSYSLSSASGIMAAGIAGASPVWSCRYAPTINPTSLALVRSIQFAMGGLGTAFAAGTALFKLFAIRGYTVADTGGGTLTLNTAITTGKIRTSYGITGMVDFRTSATAALTAGTQTIDTNPIRAINAVIGTTASVQYVPVGTLIYDVQPGEQPIILAANEGLVLQATVPATGTWNFSVAMDFDEVASY